MRIAVIIERADISLGGAERSVSELTEALRAGGHDVTSLAATGKDTPGVVTLCSEYEGKRTPWRVFRAALLKHLSESNYDIVHSVLPFEFADVYQPRGGAYPESILRNAASYQNPVIGFYKRITAFANIKRLPLVRAEKKLCQPGQKPVIIALSNYVARSFRKHYNLPENRLKTIANGIKLPDIVKDKEASRKKKLKEWNIPQTDDKNPLVFLFAAHNFRLKGLKFLIKAFACALKNTENPAWLVVIGKDNPARYKRTAEALDISDKVIFRPPEGNLNDSISACDVTVLPTFYDPCSRFTLESLAMLTPVITSSYNGVGDLMTDQRHGIIIESPSNVDKFSDAIRYFMDKRKTEQAANAVSEDNLRSKISIKRVVEELTDLYKSIVK
jgi:glycosyltransferase involved in cell wall biosynthesis